MIAPPVDVQVVAPLRLATRRSALAMAQSRQVGEALAALTGRPVELVEVTSQGDVDTAPLTQIGGTGVFVVAVREAVVDGRADVAVHSLKDLPTAPDSRLRIAAVPLRADPRDALVARDGATLSELPSGARIGTGSPRRRAQIVVARPDVEVVDIRGNVDTRMARVISSPAADDEPGTAPAGDLDAVVLAAAGLARLGRRASITETIDPERVMPAPGQGALAVEVRADLDPGDGVDASATMALSDALRRLDDPHSRAAVAAERSLLAALEAGCSAPIGALAVIEDGPETTVHLRAVLARQDGSLVHMSSTGPIEQAELIGRRLAGEMLAGAHRVLDQAAMTGPTTDRRPSTATGPFGAGGPTPAHRGSIE